jgi:hypothetical protein
MKNFTDKIVVLIERSRQIMPRLSIVVIEAVKSDVARELHQEGMYSEKEVKQLTNEAYLNGIKDIGLDAQNEWFEANKKKIEL